MRELPVVIAFLGIVISAYAHPVRPSRLIQMRTDLTKPHGGAGSSYLGSSTCNVSS